MNQNTVKEKKIIREEEPTNMVTIYMQKNNPNRVDMRYKSSREFVKGLSNSKFWEFMQRLAVLTGSPKIMCSSHLRWELWFNPIWRIKQWYAVRKPTKIYKSP